MEIYFDKYHQPEKPDVHLGTSDNRIICKLNGIDESTFQLTQNLNNTYELSFDVFRYIDIDGKAIENDSYDLLHILMRLYVDGVGWFIMSPPQQSNDGTKEKKSISALSAESEMEQHNLTGLKINKGTTDSYEMLVEGNVEMVGEVEFAKEQIKFYNKDNPELSFLDIVLKVSEMYGWSVGYVDTTPHVYRTYEDGKYKEKQVMLEDEIGSFEIDSQTLYSFLTQEAAKYFNCIFSFDFKNFKINAYRPENLGKDTNINIGFRNIQQSNNIVPDESNIYTRYTVQGSDDLGITYVNFGTNIIEDLSHFTNEKYMSKELIKKYSLWKTDVEIYRTHYIENTRLYNQQQSVITELHNRLPLDDCSTDWSTFEDGELLEAQANYQAQLKGYEQFYVDDEGNFDEEALKNSVDADDYYQIRDVILPSIQIEIDNRNLPDDVDPDDYIDSYKTNWKLYGLDELKVNIDIYENDKKVAKDAGCTEPYNADTSTHTEDYHTALYEKYLKAVNQLNPDFVDSCAEAYALRQSEVDTATELLNQYDAARKEAYQNANKGTWKHKKPDSDESYSFTIYDLAVLSKLYIDGTYTNDNMFLTSSDDAVTAIDEQLKLLDAAQEDLSIVCRPQYKYDTGLDNFLALYDYKNYTSNLSLGDFIWLGIRDDYVVKLRVVSMTYNPLTMDNNLQITFSDMLESRSGRDDFYYLINSSTGGSKNNSSSGSSNDFLSNEGVTLTAGLIQKLLASGAFSNKVSSIVNNEFAGYIGKTITVNELNAKIIKALDIEGENGFFEYLQSKLISADKIIADSVTIKQIDALVANIKNAIIGTSTTETGIIVRLTADNAVIDEAFIKQVIAQYISVNELKAGNINTNQINILSEDGSLSIVGNTQAFKDKNGNTRIQIGEDAEGNFTFVVYDETGNGVVLDQDGIRESAISDGLIKNDMIADQTIGKEKVNWSDAGASIDENGNPVWNSAQITIDGEGLDVKFSSIVSSINDIKTKTESIEKQIASIDLTGEIIFVESNNLITPNMITIHARCKGTATVDKWFINDIENTEFVSQDKSQLMIPSSYMSDKTSIRVKAQNEDGSIYDSTTVYKVSDNSNDPYTVILTNESVLFSIDSYGYPTTDQTYRCSVMVYRGAEKVNHFTVGEINGLNGVAVSKENSTITLSVVPDVQLTTRYGEFMVHVTVNGITFEKPISWNTIVLTNEIYSGSFTSSEGTVFDKTKLSDDATTLLTAHVYVGEHELDREFYQVEWYQSKDNGTIEIFSSDYETTVSLDENNFATSNDIYFGFDVLEIFSMVSDDGYVITTDSGYTIIISEERR